VADITILIPTLNEEENIDLLMERIMDVRLSSALGFSVLFIDSASTDRTCAKVRSWVEKGPVEL
jgi:glycosyltransferase involved in cell wall biosynthesis